MSASSGVRLAVVVDHPIQYFSPAFRELARSRTVQAIVVYWDAQEGGFFDPDFGIDVRWDLDLLSGYHYVVAEGNSVLAKTRQTIRRLKETHPDVLLLFGWSDPITRVALAWSIVRRVPALLYGDSTPQHSSTGRRGALRRALLRILMKSATGAFTTGSFNRDFYLTYGMAPERLHEGVLPADIDLYSQGFATGSRDARFTIGFVGKLIQRKGVHELIDALSSLGDGDWNALIIGEGPERTRLERQAADAGVTTRVEFLGFRNQRELPALLGSCDVLVVPSLIDFRVLVVAEAMAAGTPTIVSSNTAVWGEGDLVEHGVTGWVYPPGDPDALARQLRSLMEAPNDLAAVRAAAAQRVQSYGPSGFARQLEIAVAEVTTRHRTRRPGPEGSSRSR